MQSANSPTRRNIELKARLRDPQGARQLAQQFAGTALQIQQQIDTYFHCDTGRLKLREISSQSAELIWYQRPDRAAPKRSDYRLLTVPDPRGMYQLLEAALGVRIVVRKRREIALVGNVRIHLDQVESLGDFLEFEAVLDPDQDERDGHEQLRTLQEQFGLESSDLLTSSYADLLETADPDRSSPR